MSFLLPCLWFFAASLSPYIAFYLVSMLGPDAVKPHPALHDGKPGITASLALSMGSSKSSYNTEDSWQNQRAVREDRQLTLLPGITDQAHSLDRRSPRQRSTLWQGDLPGTTSRTHQQYFSCGAMRPCYV